MQHDVETQGEGDEEEGVPDQEGDEGFENLVEHGHIDVVPVRQKRKQEKEQEEEDLDV